MARIGIFTLPWIGHLNPLTGLARELAGRGHEVVFFSVPDRAEWLSSRGFRCAVFGDAICPPGTLPRLLESLSRSSGLEGVGAALDITTLLAKATLREAPPVIEKEKLDLWIVDQFDWAASTHAQHLKAPYVTVILGVMNHQEEGVPGFSGEPYTNDPASHIRDRHHEEEMRKLGMPLREFLDSYRLQAGMEPHSDDKIWSQLAEITQQPAEFEFPRRQLPGCFHFTGPFTRPSTRSSIAFPWERLNGKPLLYVSFGTVVNRDWALYEAVAEATADLDVQTVISLGREEEQGPLPSLPGDTLVVNFAPQIEILERAALLITHAGMNSTLESLAAGVPMVALPVVNDQPGVAARIEWTGTGVRIPPDERDPVHLRQAIKTVLGDGSFCAAAHRFQRTIKETGGLGRAAEIIERVIATGQPVLRDDIVS